MSARGLSKASVDALVSFYAEAAAAHGRASRDGDQETANKQHDAVAAAYRELRLRGPEVQRALLPLLDHPDAAVRGWAGAHALEFAPEEGEPVLADLAAAGGLAGFNAEMTLESYRDGTLHFP